MSLFRHLFKKRQPTQTAPSVPPELRSLLQQVQTAKSRYLQAGDQAALNAAVEAWEEIWAHPAFAAASPGFQLAARNDGALLFLRRYWARGDLRDLTIALSQWETCVAATPSGSPDLPVYLNNLVIGLSDRYARTGDLADLERAIGVAKEVVAATTPGSPEKAAILSNLGGCLRDRYERMGDLADLERAIGMFEEAVAATPPGSPDLPGYLNNLGSGLRGRYARTGELADLERAIGMFEEAVAVMPPGSPEKAVILTNLGTGLHDHYARTGDLADLERAIGVYEEAVAAMPPGSPGKAAILTNLGTGLHDHYARTGDLADLERMIGVYEEAVVATPPSSPEKAAILSNLGNGLWTHYTQTGDLADLERAIGVYEQAVVAAPSSSPDFPGCLHNLGTGLRARYTRTGDLADLERAIGVVEEAAATTTPGSPNLPSRLNSLGGDLYIRYERTGDLGDLERSIGVCKEAVAVTPLGSPDLPGCLNNLGNGLHARYVRTGDLGDLERAIGVVEEAVAATPPGSPDLPGYLNNLGNGLRARYARTGDLADLERAIGVYKEAVAATPPGSPDLPSLLNSLGNGLSDRYARTEDLSDAKGAVASWQQACALGLDSAVERALSSSRNWGNFLLDQGKWAEAAGAYGHGFEAISRIYRTQALRQSKETWLRTACELPGRAAYAFARAEQPQEAVLALERSRARLLSEVLERDRADLAALATQAPEAYTAYTTAVTQLQALEAQDVSDQPNQPTGQTLVDTIRAARAALDAAIEVARTVPGYADFLAEPDWADVQAAVTPEQPLVYIVATSAGGLALIVLPDVIIPVWLDTLTDTALRERLQRPADDPSLGGYLGTYFAWRRNARDGDAREAWFAALQTMLDWLSETVMQPIVTALQERNLSRPVLVPTSLLGLLPLHAATPEGFTFAYTPNARALSAARKTAIEILDVTSLLAVDNPDESLRFSGDEVAAVLDTFAVDSRLHLAHRNATEAAVRDALGRHDVWHFSTHGWAGWDTPLDGGLLLANDARLTLRDLLQLKADAPDLKARLAVLSACETGIPGTAVPDEVISLPTGLLQAGVAGVVGTLWAVNDFSTAMLMARFYEAWRVEGQSPPEALVTAQRWLQESTTAELAAYFKHQIPEFAPDRMPEAVASQAYWRFALSQDQDKRPFAHPFYWAGFYYTGV